MYKMIVKKSLSALLIATMVCGAAFAGNTDRAGQAGAGELLINPWARSAGWGGVNTGGVAGLEATFLNIAGMAHTKKTELSFANTNWLKGSDITINAFGLAQKVGESGVLGLIVSSMNFGDIEITTTESPEGGIGTYNPQFVNVGLAYARTFSNRIYGGLLVRAVSEGFSTVKASGVCFDAGIQYVTGFNEAKDNLRFGISLRNVGTSIKFDGDGLSSRFTVLPQNYTLAVQQRAERFELPSLLHIGATYDFNPAENHDLTAAANFTSNSFSNDEYGIGLQYGFKKMFMVRAGYIAESSAFDSDEEDANVHSGFTAGATVEIPLGKSDKKLGIDYAFRASDPFDNTHTIGAILKL